MSSAPSLSLEKLASINAKIGAGQPRDRVLADAGVSAEAFERAHEVWFGRMASEAKHGQSRKLHKRYHDLLRAQRKDALRQARQTGGGAADKAPVTPEAHLSPLAAQYRPDAQRVAAPEAPDLRLQVSPAAHAPAVAAMPQPPVIQPPAMQHPVMQPPIVQPPVMVAAPPPMAVAAPVVIAAPPTAAVPPADDPLMRTVTVASSPLRKADALPFKPSPMIGVVGKPAKPKRETISFKAVTPEDETKMHAGPTKAALPFAPKPQDDNPLEQTQFTFRAGTRPEAAGGEKPQLSPLEETSTLTAAARKAALPFASRPKVPETLEETRTQVPMRAAKKEALPFTPQQPADNPLEMSTQLVKPGATKAPLPFAGAATPQQRAPAGPAEPPKTTGLPFQQPATSRQSSAPPAMANASLPFQQPAAPQQQPVAQSATTNTSLPFQQPAAPQQQPVAQSAAANTSLPFQRPPAPSVTSERPTTQAPPAPPTEPLDLSRYACLCAELAAFPQESERVFARYGLAEPRTRASVDATWRKRLGDDPQLYRAWQDYYQHYYSQWFAKGRRP